jgi:hypothetical protein
VVLVGVVVAVGALGVLHALPTGLSPVRDAVSHYGITRYRLGYRVLTMAMAVAGLSAALGLGGLLHGRSQGVDPFLAGFALARAAISWFPMDEPGAEPTHTGRRHLLLALVAFFSVTVAALRLPNALAAESLWAGSLSLLRVLGWLLLVTALLMFATGRLSGGKFFGLGERAFYAAAFCWLAVVGLALA